MEQFHADRGRTRPEPRLPSALDEQVRDLRVELARTAFRKREWSQALAFLDGGSADDSPAGRTMRAEAYARLARREALKGRFAIASGHAARAVELDPANTLYQERRRLVRAAGVMALGDFREPLFPDTVGPTRGHWWETDLLGRVRGWDGTRATVDAPTVLRETRRGVLEDVYAVGGFKPWHEAGPESVFSRWVRALKPSGVTIPYASILLRQGLCEETDWIEDIDVIVPVPTSLRSYEERGFELTEQLADDLSRRLCVSMVDVFETDPHEESVHRLGDYHRRAAALARSMRVKTTRSQLLERAEAVLLIDDVVTYGATFEACALRLRDRYPGMRVYAASLAYTQTRARAERFEAEQRATTAE